MENKVQPIWFQTRGSASTRNASHQIHFQLVSKKVPLIMQYWFIWCHTQDDKRCLPTLEKCISSLCSIEIRNEQNKKRENYHIGRAGCDNNWIVFYFHNLWVDRIKDKGLLLVTFFLLNITLFYHIYFFIYTIFNKELSLISS